jgi:hypothetical protein
VAAIMAARASPVVASVPAVAKWIVAIAHKGNASMCTRRHSRLESDRRANDVSSTASSM